MTRSKRPRTLSRSEVPRAELRDSVAISGTFQVGERPIEDVLVTDLSADGCRLNGNSVGVTKSEPMRLWLGEYGPIAARLKWLKQGSLGLAFDAVLDEAVLRQLHAMPAPPSNVVPLKRSAL